MTLNRRTYHNDAALVLEVSELPEQLGITQE
jgi:hypothetical protein